MTHPADKIYRFQALKHWGQGLAEGFLFDEGPDGALVTPGVFTAHTLATAPHGETIEVLAVDSCGRLLWLLSDGSVMASRDAGAVQMAMLPRSVAHGARRLIWGQRTAWVVNGGSIVRVDALSGDRTGVFDASGWRVADAVADRCDGAIVVEYAVDGQLRLRRIRPEGQAKILPEHDGFAAVIAAVRWGDDGPIHVVDRIEGGVRVGTFAPDGSLNAPRDYAGRLLLGPTTMDGPGRLVMAEKGGRIFTVAFGLMEAVREIEAEGRFRQIRDLLWTDRGLYAATAHGLHALEEVTGTAPAGTARYFSPALYSPLGDRSGWLRADLIAELPQGAQLTITSRAFESSLSATAYTRALRNEPNGPVVQEGWNEVDASVHFGDGSTRPLRHYLGDETSEYLALRLDVSVPACAGAARFKRLDVLYPNRSLIDALPAIYRTGTRSEQQLRRMLAPFQALADEIDDLIGESIRRVDPHQADDLWTGFLLSWLGHRDFAGLPADQRRALLVALPKIVQLRGTLAGLIRVMETLAPEGFSIEDGGAEPDFWVLPKPMDPAGARLGRETLAARHQPDALVLGDCRPLGSAALRHGCLDLERFAQCSGNVTVRVFGGDDIRERLDPFTDSIARYFAPANTRLVFIFGEHRPPERLVRRAGTGPDRDTRTFITLDEEKSRALGAWRLPRVGPSTPEHSPVLNSAVLDGNLTLE